MKTEIRKFVVAVATLGLLASCAQPGGLDVHNRVNMAAPDTGTFADNDSIKRWFETTSKELMKHLWAPCG